MKKYYSKDLLRRIRNEISIEDIIENELDIRCKRIEGYFRFLCPQCGDFHTATNPETNLARCFKCRVNFNPIDLMMAVKKWEFRETVEFLSDKF